MKIYTKTGDDGTTGVIGGRLDKDHCRVAAYGEVDELNSWIGLAVTHLTDPRDADLVNVLSEIQQCLFDCGSDLATIDLVRRDSRIRAECVEQIERLIDQYDQEIRPIEDFILPGGTPAAALLHICRTVTRRAERCVVTLSHQPEPTNPEVLRYLNRLSDLFFILARVCNARAGIPDVCYRRSQKVFR